LRARIITTFNDRATKIILQVKDKSSSEIKFVSTFCDHSFIFEKISKLTDRARLSPAQPSTGKKMSPETKAFFSNWIISFALIGPVYANEGRQ
jgi:hypothetical protein